jgi:hypothetical protein
VTVLIIHLHEEFLVTDASPTEEQAAIARVFAGVAVAAEHDWPRRSELSMMTAGVTSAGASADRSNVARSSGNLTRGNVPPVRVFTEVRMSTPKRTVMEPASVTPSTQCAAVSTRRLVTMTPEQSPSWMETRTADAIIARGAVENVGSGENTVVRAGRVSAPVRAQAPRMPKQASAAIAQATGRANNPAQAMGEVCGWAC